jgi:hypothetical protein
VSWSHLGRCRNDAAYAALAGASPIPASSGRVVRHRLNRGGDKPAQPRPARHSSHPLARLPTHPRLHHPTASRRQKRRRNPPLPQALHRPRALPLPQHRHGDLTNIEASDRREIRVFQLKRSLCRHGCEDLESTTLARVTRGTPRRRSYGTRRGRPRGSRDPRPFDPRGDPPLHTCDEPTGSGRSRADGSSAVGNQLRRPATTTATSHRLHRAAKTNPKAFAKVRQRARDGIRTRTAERPTRFKLVVAADYTTRASGWSIRDGRPGGRPNNRERLLTLLRTHGTRQRYTLRV